MGKGWVAPWAEAGSHRRCGEAKVVLRGQKTGSCDSGQS